ncbi:PACE efflux transporter [Lichenihabitans psoromatis]|uniref:PACE efflux transporter n=1 Tax=Lichenihabitans psoromatis TaxID=2528642 RepID=UPI0013F14396|nr:PACE efflux transporter [Lichenihabitans psoromatis]
MRSIKERIVHTLLFEIGAIASVSPAIAWMTGRSMAEASAVSLALSVVATICNYCWTIFFDRMFPTRHRNFLTRAAQAIGLEFIITLFAVPLFYFFAGATLLQAFILDFGSIGFFIVYAMAYNWVFDRVMLRIEASSA